MAVVLEEPDVGQVGEDRRARPADAKAQQAEEVGRPRPVGEQELDGEQVEDHARRAAEAVLARARACAGGGSTGTSATLTPIQDATAGMKRCISP